MKQIRSLVTTLGMLAVAAAVLQEMQKAPEERTWHGQVFGMIPYDFRLPTLARVKASLWNPDDPHLLTSEVFGVGWSVNFYQVKQRLMGATGAV